MSPQARSSESVGTAHGWAVQTGGLSLWARVKMTLLVGKRYFLHSSGTGLVWREWRTTLRSPSLILRPCLSHGCLFWFEFHTHEYLLTWVSVHHVYSVIRRYQIPWSWIIGSYKLPCRSWDMTLSHLQGWLVVVLTLSINPAKTTDISSNPGILPKKGKTENVESINM